MTCMTIIVLIIKLPLVGLYAYFIYLDIPGVK